jgi:hypothetical protein
MFKITTQEQYKKIASDVASIQAEYVKKGMGQSDARKRAGEQAATRYNTTREALEASMAAARNTLYDREKEQPLNSVTERYEKVCKDFGEVPSDRVVAILSGCTTANLWHARRKMEEAGYTFTMNMKGNGYKVEPPQEAKYTEDDLQRAIAAALRELTK